MSFFVLSLCEVEDFAPADICPCGAKRIASALVSKLPRLTAILAPTRVCYAHALWSIPAAKAGRKRKTTSFEVVFLFLVTPAGIEPTIAP